MFLKTMLIKKCCHLPSTTFFLHLCSVKIFKFLNYVYDAVGDYNRLEDWHWWISTLSWFCQSVSCLSHPWSCKDKHWSSCCCHWLTKNHFSSTQNMLTLKLNTNLAKKICFSQRREILVNKSRLCFLKNYIHLKNLE